MSAFSAYLYKDEASCVAELLLALHWPETMARNAADQAADVIAKMRASKRKPGELESFLQQYSLNTGEGLAMMALAEALLRIPDKKTANDLIADKVAAANWLENIGSSEDWLVKAAGVGLMMTARTLESALARMAKPMVREAMVKAMQIMGGQFVLGQTIAEGIKNAAEQRKKGYRLSFDMLGEGARTAEDAERYFNAYMHAIQEIAADNLTGSTTRRSGISVKLSALHPRYEYSQKGRCIPALAEKIKALAEKASSHKIALTIDAEEAHRLDLSLEIVAEILSYRMFDGWDDFGLAVQAYQKRCAPLIDHVTELARTHRRRLQVRLVKGAYWDSEIKWAQMEGLPGYPVFTRKANTDLSYLACAQKMLQATDRIYPMFATHNAHTVCAVLELAKAQNVNAKEHFEFQRLHGMGENLYDILLREKNIDACIYAPVGKHADLLPYLVRRLLENGANSSFVHKILNKDTPVEELIRDPVNDAKSHPVKTHPKIRMPADTYQPERTNSRGIDLKDDGTAQDLLRRIGAFTGIYKAAPLIAGKIEAHGTEENIRNPAKLDDLVGTTYNTGPRRIERAFAKAKEGFRDWSHMPAEARAAALDKLAGLLEEHHAELMALCIREAGKTIPDARDEVREAVDFCRYYAAEGRKIFSETLLPGPTGERNSLKHEGRGIFVCISPWNFPLAIFTGQVTAALMAGNAVIAKPAEQTPLIAMKAVQLMHEAGIPATALQLLPGDGSIGAQIVQHPDVAGVAFTGSSEAARDINRSLAAKDGPIATLIAETGGQNALIADSSSLPEQVVDDTVRSAFGSAGQRCSALRVLFLQSEIADKTIDMLKGAMRELRVGDPAQLSTDVGPVIDEDALHVLTRHRQNLEGFGRLLAETPMDKDLKEQGHFFAPCAFEIDNIFGLTREVFGPILHVIRYDADKIADVVEGINATGYGLTFGVHSRIESFQEYLATHIRAGNVYINKPVIGAVVGTQPFGGRGFSGTGPKAGGPHYLPRFASEKAISINTTASGGNTSLVTLEE